MHDHTRALAWQPRRGCWARDALARRWEAGERLPYRWSPEGCAGLLAAPTWQSKRWWPAGDLPPDSETGYTGTYPRMLPPPQPPIRVRRTRGRRGGRRQRQRTQSKEGRTKKWIPKQIQRQEITKEQSKAEPAKQFVFNGEAKEFVRLDRKRETKKCKRTMK